MEEMMGFIFYINPPTYKRTWKLIKIIFKYNRECLMEMLMMVWEKGSSNVSIK